MHRISRILINTILFALLFSPLHAQTDFLQIKRLLAPDAAVNDYFGYSVSIDGEVAVAGAYLDDVDDGMGGVIVNAGSAYVFRKGPDGWAQEQKLVAATPSRNDRLGIAVDISGELIIVGGDESAYVFRKQAGRWVEEQKLVPIMGLGSSNMFGWAVGISGTTAIVGAYEEDADADDAGFDLNAGAAYIFEYNGSAWQRVQKLVADDRQDHDNFGISVSIDEDVAIMGAYLEEEDVRSAFFNLGAAYIFRKGSSEWTQEQKLVASARNTQDFFGRSVDISGDVAIVSAPNQDEDVNNDNVLENAGAAYIFRRASGTWTEEQKITASDRAAGDEFGSSVSISGNTVVVGAGRWDKNEAGMEAFQDVGAAYIFHHSGGVWPETQIIVNQDQSNGDLFGSSVGISGDNIIVGAYGKDEGQSGTLNFIQSAGISYIFGPAPPANVFLDDSGNGYGTITEALNAIRGGVEASVIYIPEGVYDESVDFSGLTLRVVIGPPPGM